MVTSKQSVVTPERYATGKPYAEYRASFTEYGDRYDENYAATVVSDKDAAYLKNLMAQPGGVAKVMVITENWCPDCYREAPVMARVAEACGMELRVFERDQHKDIMAEFKKDGEFESIPVFVFYTKTTSTSPTSLSAPSTPRSTSMRRGPALRICPRKSARLTLPAIGKRTGASGGRPPSTS